MRSSLSTCVVSALVLISSGVAHATRTIAVIPNTFCAAESVQEAFAVTARQLTPAQLSKARLELARVEDRGVPVMAVDMDQHQYVISIATGVSDPYEWFVSVHQEALLGKNQPKMCLASPIPWKPGSLY